MQLTLSQVCSLPSPFTRDVEDYAANQCFCLEAWLTKLEQYLQANSVDALRKLLDDHGVTIPVASYQGGLLDSQGEKRAAAWEDFQRRLDLCRELGIGTLVVACDVAAELDQTLLERVQLSLRQAAQRAEAAEVRLALEPQAAATLGNNLQTAAVLVSEVGSAWLGLCLDIFHFHVGPSKYQDLGYLTAENLFHVQLSDVADYPREFAADAHRILPGDGEIPLGPVRQRLREIGYAGTLSIELMNPQIWQVPAAQFGDVGIAALKRFWDAQGN